MKTLFLLLLFCHGSSAVKYTIKMVCIGSTGLPNFPEFVVSLVLEGILFGYCDTNIKTVEIKQDWAKMVMDKIPQGLLRFNAECLETQPTLLKATIDSLKQIFNQSGGVHVLQRMYGCEWDDETGEVNGFDQYGYKGEDLISFDLKTLTWIAQNPQAVTLQQRWNADKATIKTIENDLTLDCPEWLKMYLASGNGSLLRTERPSVSLLQKTPSSPVSCHATGFYPERATLSWRKDGEELHEDVELGEILPNHDGTFQMSAELKLSSVTPEDWSRYTCVFQLSGVKEEIVTKLDKADIRTNEVKLPDTTLSISIIIIIIVSVVVLLLVLIAAIGVVAYKMKKNKKTPVDTFARESLTSTSESETSSPCSSISSVGSNTPLVTAS